jgi:hypothetical protein
MKLRASVVLPDPCDPKSAKCVGCFMRASKNGTIVSYPIIFVFSDIIIDNDNCI